MPKNRFSDADHQNQISYSCFTPQKTYNYRKTPFLDELLLDLYQSE